MGKNKKDKDKADPNKKQGSQTLGKYESKLNKSLDK